MNIQTALNKACSNLIKKNIKSANLDTEILMSNVIKKDRKYIILNYDKDLSRESLNKFISLVKQREKGKPVYITGKDFGSTNLKFQRYFNT